MTSRKTGIPAKPRAVPAPVSDAAAAAFVCSTWDSARETLATDIMAAANFGDQAEAEILPHARLRRLARGLLEASGASAMVIPDHDGRVLAFGSPADLLQLLSHRVPKRVRYRDAITGLFVRAKEAFRRPKTTVREENSR